MSDITTIGPISVHWDASLPPVTPKTPEEKAIERWDEWFALAGVAEEWSKIKQACADTQQTNKQIIRWAEITELTRLDKFVKNE